MLISITINPVGGKKLQLPEKQSACTKEPAWSCSTQPGAWTRKKVSTYHAAAVSPVGTSLVTDDSELSSLSGDDAEGAANDMAMEEAAQSAKRTRVAVEQKAVTPHRHSQAWPPIASSTGNGTQNQFDELRDKVDTLASQFAQLMIMMKMWLDVASCSAGGLASRSCVTNFSWASMKSFLAGSPSTALTILALTCH